MYRRSTGRITNVSYDLMNVQIRIPLNYKNRNYVNSIFGGSMFSAVDPIPMIQLINILGNNFVVWDKAAEIHFKIPAKETIYANFTFTEEELEKIKKEVESKKEIEIVKTTFLVNKEGNKTFCKVNKTLYIADKSYYKNKRKSST